MRRILRIHVMLLAAAVAMLLAGPAAAQEPDAPRELPRLRQVCAGSMVRVLTTASETVLGRCGPVEDTRLVVRDTAGRVRDLPYRTVAGVWVRRSGARQGAIAGGVVAGAVAGVWVGLIINTLCNGDGGSGCGDDIVLGSLAAAGLGGLGGAAVGGAIGSTTRVWVRVYP